MPTVKDCVFGQCKCADAAACQFKRCKNCDMPVDDNGKALFDNFHAHLIDSHGHYRGKMFEFYGDEPVHCNICNGPCPKL